MSESKFSEFVLESREHLQVFERSMLALEKADDVQRMDSIDAGFRAVHSLKGNSGFFGFPAIQRLAHATESILETYRASNAPPPVQAVELLLQAMDRLSVMIEDLANCEAHEVPSLLGQLWSLSAPPSPASIFPFRLELDPTAIEVLHRMQTLVSIGTVHRFQMTAFDFETPIPSWQDRIAIACELHTSNSLFDVKRTLGDDVAWAALGGTELSEHDSIWSILASDVLGRAGSLQYEPEDFSVGAPKPPIVWVSDRHALASASTTTFIADLGGTHESQHVNRVHHAKPAEPVEAVAPVENLAIKNLPQPSQPSTENRLVSLRIPVEQLDRLMNLVGELTLVRNQSLLAFEDSEGNPRAILQRLDSVTSELQEAVLKTRMQPVGNLFGRFPRMVRDLGRQLGKQIDLILVGQEVELDKTVLEQLSDPLTHLIRNSADHGLETPDVRQRAGKSPVGKITLSATAADGQVILEIKDDGRGIDPQAIRSKLIALGLKTEPELQRMPSKELFSHILLPGFSTAKQVSDVSGRGVGMDVVKTNIQRLEGTLSLDSSPGLGTSIVLRVPLTLAILPCLIVLVGEQRFVVPQRGLEEIVCLYAGGRGAVEQAYDMEFFRLRDLLLPVVRFNEVLKQRGRFNADVKADIITRNAPADRAPDRIEYILVLRSNGRKFGLLVDDVRGTEEIVVKPMHPSLKRLGIFAGATLMGDGKVALIANIDGIADHADCLGTGTQKSPAEPMRDPAEVHRILLFEYGPEEQFALPLVQVRRIESIPMDRVERVGQHEFITIDGKSTRILRLDRFLNVSACVDTNEMHLLLPKFVDEPIGILVSRIVDTESLAIDLQPSSLNDPGILGTAILRGRLSLFVDTQFLREASRGASPNSPSIAVADGTLAEQFPTREPAALRSQQPEALASNTTQSQENQPLALHRVLLVDDTPFFREVVKRYFERMGLAVTTANDGVDGLEKLDGGTFDLVVSDIEMPNMNGWEFCKEARQSGCQTPFLALTSLNKSENATKALECGFDLFEEKLDHDRLIQAVRQLLGVHKGDAS